MREATDRCLRRLADRGDVQVAALSSTLAGLESVPEGVVHLEATYPMSRYYAAFDGAVAAAGYNAFHELIALGVPSLFVPMHRETDDQPARARFAESSQAGLAVDGPADPRLEAQLERLCDRSERERIRAGIAGLSLANGAAEAAAWLDRARAPAPAPWPGSIRGPPAHGHGPSLAAGASSSVTRRGPRCASDARR